jgi:CheY-like chemotaxis protein
MLLDDLSVLLVDDDPEALEVLAVHLKGHGADVRVASDAERAVREVAESSPDAVISELLLPDVQGPSLLAALRAAPGCAELPAVALSTHRRLAVQAQALESGFEKYLVKPARLTDVADALCSVAGERSIPGTAGSGAKTSTTSSCADSPPRNYRRRKSRRWGETTSTPPARNSASWWC